MNIYRYLCMQGYVILMLWSGRGAKFYRLLADCFCLLFSVFEPLDACPFLGFAEEMCILAGYRCRICRVKQTELRTLLCAEA